MKKSYILISSILFFTVNVFGQNIKLPDVTTVIESETKKAKKDALPEFIDLLEKTKGSGTIVPQLPNVNTEEAPESILPKAKEKEKSVFSEIVVGGGYPFLFLGNCDISGVDQTNPFKFNFKFDSANGYNGNALNNNYSDSTIDLLFDKRFKKSNLTWGFNANYSSISNGFQNQVKDMTTNNLNLIKGNGDIEYQFNNGIFLGANVNLDFYNRFASIADNVVYPNWVKKSSIISFVPQLTFGWHGHGFNVNLQGEYLLNANIFDDIAGGNNHRGKITTGFSWNNDIAKTYANVSYAFGNHINKDGFVVPFNAGFDFKFPVSFANRRFGISGEGGLMADYNSVNKLERKYRYTALSSMPYESADWYGNLSIDVPIKSSFTGNFKIEYKETAFNMGVLEPVYDDNNFVNGLYKYNQKNHRMLTTDFALTYHHNFFSLKGGWHSNWFDVPALEPMQYITLNLSFQDEKSKWGAELFGSYDITNGSTIPVININCFALLSPKVRLTASVGDLVMAFYKNPRIYSGKYIDRGFEAGVFLKFVL